MAAAPSESSRLLPLPSAAAEPADTKIAINNGDNNSGSSSNGSSSNGSGGGGFVFIAREMTARQCFTEFLSIGFQAFGGPMAQISLLKQKFVEGEKWMTPAAFNRVQGVYQLVPGPEATELCIFLGMLGGRSRLAGLLAGLGFVLPGFVLMLLLSALYVHAGTRSAAAMAAFRGIQPAVAAMMAMAVVRIAQHALVKHAPEAPAAAAAAAAAANAGPLSPKSPVGVAPFAPSSHAAAPAGGSSSGGGVDAVLLSLALTAVLLQAVGVHFLLIFVLAAVFYSLLRAGYSKSAVLFTVLVIASVVYWKVAYLPAAAAAAASDTTAVAAEAAAAAEAEDRPVTHMRLFDTGIRGGLLSVGGAYTAVPFMQAEAATGAGHWMSKAQFLDSLALSSVLPAPMVIFSTLVGFMGGNKMARVQRMQEQQQPQDAAAAPTAVGASRDHGHGAASSASSSSLSLQDSLAEEAAFSWSTLWLELCGATVCTLGMFLPAFAITIAGHEALSKLVHSPQFGAVWESITACVVGLVATTALAFVRNTVGEVHNDMNPALSHAADPLAAIIFCVTLATLTASKHPMLPVFIVLSTALTGFYFYV